MNDGVNTVCIPQRGGSKTPQCRAYEKSAAFKQSQRFRASIEGRISVLMRLRGMKRCRAEGAQISARRERVAEVRHWLSNYQELKEVIEAVCELNHDLLRPERAASKKLRKPHD